MKKNLYLLLVLIVTSFAACKKDDIVYDDAFRKSNRAWLAFKKESNNNYSYNVSVGSWTGYGSNTIILVKNGKVVERSFKSQNITYTTTGMEIVERESWTETATNLNTHDNGAATTLTLDEVYAKAKSIWLVKRKDAETFFEANNNGMISLAGYVENGCQDDCFNGITIVSINK
ncbi:MAG: hypothetical protein EOO42_01995 [Flavobacteriales bacterium]|nr:MAG: hypothetical protein EOO42_01995 [Flavobacteriales bacterium]